MTKKSGEVGAQATFSASSWMSQAGYESGKRAEVAAKELREDDAAGRGVPYVLAWLILIGLCLWLVHAGAIDFIASIGTLKK